MASVDHARTFLERYGPSGYQSAEGDRAWGAFEGSGPLVGVGILGARRGCRGRVWIAVAPERRRLGVGSELLGSIVTEAQEEGLGYLTWCHRASEVAPDRLARSLGLLIGRRVVSGMVETVAVLARNEEASNERADNR